MRDDAAREDERARARGKRDPNGDDVSCDIVKTWREEDITKRIDFDQAGANFYTAAREAYDTGISLLRPMYYDYPEAPEAYDFIATFRELAPLVARKQEPNDQPAGKPLEAIAANNVVDGLALLRRWQAGRSCRCHRSRRRRRSGSGHGKPCQWPCP